MKHEWRKAEKQYYLPKNKPVLCDIPEFKFLTIKGEGNPNKEGFGAYIEALYAMSYGIRMSYKKGVQPDGFFEYAVYPLEGVWSINEAAIQNFNGTINKDDLIFTLMIRQPDFVTAPFIETIRTATKMKKANDLLDSVQFESICEGKCIQMLHVGSYDNEPASFEIMEHHAEKNGWNRMSKIHREIYLSDARKVAPEKLKTVLRFNVCEK